MDVTITKLVQACLLVEADGKRVLIDPGSYTLEDDRFDPDMVTGVDRILITHEHFDHASPDFIRMVLDHSNGAVVESTAAVVAILERAGIEAMTTGTPQFVAPHGRLPTGPGPQNTGFHVAGALSHPGDSHDFNETMAILAMPFVSPWGSVTTGVDRARLVKPRCVVPIHDWTLGEGGLVFTYRIAEAALASDGIELVVIEDFGTATVTV